MLCFNHAEEHMRLWADGDKSEDHLGHAMANLAVMIDCGE